MDADSADHRLYTRGAVDQNFAPSLCAADGGVRVTRFARLFGLSILTEAITACLLRQRWKLLPTPAAGYICRLDGGIANVVGFYKTNLHGHALSVS